MPSGCEHDSHRPDKVSFSRPRVRRRSSMAPTTTPAPGAIEEDITFGADREVTRTMASEQHQEHPLNHHLMHIIGFKKRTATNKSVTSQGCQSPLPKLALLNKLSQRRNARHELFEIMSPPLPQPTLVSW